MMDYKYTSDVCRLQGCPVQLHCGVSGVFDHSIGDSVFGVAPGCLGHTAYAPRETLVPKPRTLSFEEAATAPTVYCTVFTAFEDLTRKRGPSDKVLQKYALIQ